MAHDWQMARRHLGVWSGLALAMAAGTVFGTLSTTRVSLMGVDHPRRVDDVRAASLAKRLAAIDAAIVASDRSRAIYAWREAYGLALGTRDWAAMVTVGDAARKIDGMPSLAAPRPTGFRAEARQAYLLALFRARDAGRPEGIARVADAFAALGDDEMAVRSRAVRVKAVRSGPSD